MDAEQTWQLKEVADHYSKIADMIIPNRREILSIIARVAIMSFLDSPRILDIGCGYGDVTAEVLRYAPKASICMVDFSEEMIQRSVKRFKEDKKIPILCQYLLGCNFDIEYRKCYHVIINVIIGGNMVRTQIQLTDKQARAIKEIAATQGVSIAEVIRRAVEGIIRSNTKVDREERQKRALEIVGKFRSGKKDISKKHDEYLTEAYGR